VKAGREKCRIEAEMQLMSNGHQLIAFIIKELGSDCSARRDLVSGFRMSPNREVDVAVKVSGKWKVNRRVALLID
jgi:hypothetical protein